MTRSCCDLLKQMGREGAGSGVDWLRECFWAQIALVSRSCLPPWRKRSCCGAAHAEPLRSLLRQAA